MWMFTKYGFFSVTRPTKDNPDTRNQVRARKRKHLEALKQRFPELSMDVLEIANVDYRYRLIVARKVFKDIAAELLDEVDYSNFKGECGRHRDWVGSDYTSALHHVWSIHNNMQSSSDADDSL